MSQDEFDEALDYSAYCFFLAVMAMIVIAAVMNY